MANSKISALTSATTPLAGTETLPIVQSSTTKKVAVSDLTAGRAVSVKSLSVTAGAVILADGYEIGWGADSTFIAGNSSSNIIQFVTAGVEGFRLDASGNIVPKTAAKGINFTANTPAAGMTSQLLNWYEEGTYTPTVTSGTGSITSYSVTAQYTRIGRQVTVCFEVVISNNGTGGGSVVVTMPFTCGAQPSVGVGRENGVTGNILQAILPASSSVAYVLTATNGYPGANGYKPTCTITYFV